MSLLLSKSSELFSVPAASTLQEVQRWGGLTWYAWLLLFLIAVVFLWWRLSRSAKQFDIEAREAGSHEEAHESDEIYEPDVEEPIAAAAIVVDEPVEIEAVPEGTVTEDLTKVEGIGPKISELLGAAGITTYAQLADTDVSRLDEILDEAGLHIADESSWPEQAGLAADGKWDELTALQDELKGGRKA